MGRFYERLVREERFLWYGFLHFLSIVAFVLFFRYRSFGRHHVPESGGVLLASNHQSFFDPILVGLPLVDRRIRQLARRTLFRNPLFAWLIRSLGAIPIEKGRGDRDALNRGIEMLKSGELLVVFPEGTRTADGSVGALQAGIFLMARRARVPIVPVAIDGAFDAWPRTRKLFRLRPIRVAYGPPVAAERGSRTQEKVHKEILRLKERLEKVRT
jgi:1-acyl-sn-glycerol-3-phosphate acyltransferase